MVRFLAVIKLIGGIERPNATARQPSSLGAFFIVSGIIHLVLFLGLSRWHLSPSPSVREQVISVTLLKADQPKERARPDPATAPVKKIPLTPTINKEAERLAEKKSAFPEAIEQPPDPKLTPAMQNQKAEMSSGRDTNISVRLDIPKTRRGDIALVPERNITVTGDRGTLGTDDSGTSSLTRETGYRDARPSQTARASYPPMALRMGLEADVVLKVLVDAEGKVMKVEVVKSGGMGFDEEAMKAVKRFRFEPARRDGENIATELTYIYRFRLER